MGPAEKLMKEREAEGDLVSKAVNGGRGVWAKFRDCGTNGQGEKPPGTVFFLSFNMHKQVYMFIT